MKAIKKQKYGKAVVNLTWMKGFINSLLNVGIRGNYSRSLRRQSLEPLIKTKELSQTDQITHVPALDHRKNSHENDTK